MSTIIKLKYEQAKALQSLMVTVTAASYTIVPFPLQVTESKNLLLM